jgi:hypothetical protein
MAFRRTVSPVSATAARAASNAAAIGTGSGADA